jgi:hypothetical protein
VDAVQQASSFDAGRPPPRPLGPLSRSGKDARPLALTAARALQDEDDADAAGAQE